MSCPCGGQQGVRSVHVQDELLQLDGFRLHYRDWAGPTDADETLLLLHGLTAHARQWDSFAAHMSRHCRVVAPDLRGHGESQWVDSYGLDSQVADVRSLVAALGLDHITLVGQSLGGSISILYSGGVPAELARLVLVDIAPTIPKSTRKQMYTDFEQAARFDSPEQAIATELAANPRASHEHLSHRIRNAIQRLADGSWTWRYDPALRQPGAIAFHGAEDEGWAAAGRIQVPTLVMRGAESEYLTPENAKRLVATIPTCELVEFANCGHVVPIDEPDGFRDAMTQFMSLG